MEEALLRVPIRLPDLGIEDAELMLSVWLVPVGARVAVGDRIVEIVTGEAVVDLPAPRRGILREKLVREDSIVQTGQVLGWVEQTEE